MLLAPFRPLGAFAFPPRRFRRAGVTLIELLLAVAIASLVIALVYSTYRTVTVTLDGQRAREAASAPPAAAMDELTRDLACTYMPDDKGCGFTVSPAAANRTEWAELSFCTLRAPTNELDLRWFEPERAAYRVVRGADQVPSLVRESQPLAGPGSLQPPETNVLVKGVEKFAVTVYNGTEWQDEWPAAGGAATPQAARVSLVTAGAGGPKTFETEVLIPAGITVTSRIERAATP